MKSVFKFLILLLSLVTNVNAQDSLWSAKPKIDFSGYLETFYSYDFNEPTLNSRHSFLYNFNRQNEFNVNFGLVKVAISNTKYRANFALQTGTYVVDNLANEASELRWLNEANVGISLNAKNNLWLDVGIMPSHIGFESTIGTNNQNVTRSILAENSPYFLTGAKVSYEPSSKWLFSVSVLNGWQRIKRLENNSLLSFGSQVMYKMSDNLVFNWSTFVGTDTPDTERKMRYFNNFYSQWKPTDKLNFTFGFDVGLQQKEKKSSAYDVWFSPVIISQYLFSKKWSSALRLEYYQDKHNVIVNPYALGIPFEVKGSSLNFDYTPFKNAKLRFEGKYFNGTNNLFLSETAYKKDCLMMTTSLSLQF